MTWRRYPVLLLVVLCTIAVAIALVVRDRMQSATSANPSSTAVSGPSPVPSAWATMHSSSGAPTALLAALQTTTVPQRDLADLGRRYKAGMLAPKGPLPLPSERTVGSKGTFWVTDMESMRHFTVTATLQHVSEHLYMYTDDRLRVNDDAIRASATFFEEHIYPTTWHYFGDAWRAGYDGDERITVLNTRHLGATGAFSSADEEPPLANPYSNGRHMIYMSLEQMSPGTQIYNSVLAHEFQHAVHFFHDRDEDAWLNEGMAVLNEMLNGLDGGYLGLDAFRRFPHTQLTTWGDEPDRLAHYGAAFAFLSYFRQRYGDAALLWLVAEPANGGAGIDQVLARLGVEERFDDVFADWVVALMLDNERVEDGRFSLADFDLRLVPTARASVPSQQTTTIGQYTPYAVEIPATAAGATFFFTGTTHISLVPTAPHSGVAHWYGNRGDMMDATLTRSFDLTRLSRATLAFWVWYDLEEGWDYAYVSVSTDEGQSWTTLPTRYTTTENPVGNNLGHGYTGRSGGSDKARWVADAADLTPYAGKHILVRFEYVTDDAVTRPGFCVDDISIPELGFADDAESAAGWDARGFVHSVNLIPQTFSLRLITFGRPISVRDVMVDDQSHVQMMLAPGQRAIVVIAATAPVTTEAAQIEYAIHSP